MSSTQKAISRTQEFCQRLDISVPILLAPMAGACPPSLSAAIANAGGMGACGALLMTPNAIEAWVEDFKATSKEAFQLNLWIPDDAPSRNPSSEKEMRTFLKNWGPEVASTAGDGTPPDFDAQCDTLISAKPTAISSIMGLYPAPFVKRMKENGITWLATATTVAEACEAEAAGADIIVAQGSEAGGHRGAFHADDAMRKAIGLFSLLPAIVDAVNVPVVATGGISDGRTIAAALTLGASAVQIGTGFLRCPESNIKSSWRDAIATAQPEDTLVTRAFSGRAGRSIATDFALAMEADTAPKPAPYPVQRGLTGKMREEGTSQNDIARIQAWAGQSARLAPDKPAGEHTIALWDNAQSFLR